MEVYIQVILIIATLKYCLKAAQNSRLRTIAFYAMGASVLAFAIYPIVIEQPLNIIDKMLEDKELVSDWAVLVTIEAVTGIMISIRLLDNYFRPKTKRSKVLKTIRVIPGILFFISIAYFELEFFRLRAGRDFLGTAILYSSIVFAVVSLFSAALKYSLDGESIKLELKMLLNLAIMAVGLLVNSSVAEYVNSFAVADTDLTALAGICSMTIIFSILGYYLNKFKPFKKR